MNTFITVAFKQSGESKIIAKPGVPYETQRKIFQTFSDTKFSEIEMWSRSQGKIRGRKIKLKKKLPSIASNEAKEEPNDEKTVESDASFEETAGK